MRKRAALGLLIWLTTALGGRSVSIAQSPDPYADEQRKAKLAMMQEELQHYKDNVIELYFALGCKVFQNEAQFAYLRSAYFEKLNREYVDNEMFSPKVFQGLLNAQKASADEGLAQSKDPNSCEVWHDNPAAVLEIRKLAEAARPRF